MALTFEPGAYGPEIAALLAPARLAELGPGSPNMAARQALASLKIDRLANGSPIHNPDMARCCLSGLWLYHDFLDESHAISQEIETSTGSYWHGIMHRREPDASNAAYWFRRVGAHPIFAALAVEAKRSGFQFGASAWDPFDFIDHCEKHRGKGNREEMQLRQLQQREWELLFEWCFRQSMNASS